MSNLRGRKDKRHYFMMFGQWWVSSPGKQWYHRVYVKNITHLCKHPNPLNLQL